MRENFSDSPAQRAEHRPDGLIVMQGTAGRTARFICIFSEKGKVALSAGRKTRFNSNFSGKEKQQHTAATPPPQTDISRRYQRFPPPRRGYVPGKGKSAAYLEQVSTTVPKFAYRAFCPCGKLVGECLPQTLLLRLAPLIPAALMRQERRLRPCERNTTRPTAAAL